MNKDEKLLRILLILGYLYTTYLFLTAIGPEKAIGTNPIAPVIAPLLILAGALNFMTNNPIWKQRLLDIQLFIVGCFLPPAFVVFYPDCRFYHAGLRFSIPPLCALVLVFILLLLLRWRAQRKND